MSGDAAARRTGTVRFFDQDRGFGFIAPDDGSADVFVHVADAERSGLPVVDEGMKLSFAMREARPGKGPKAVELRFEG